MRKIVNLCLLILLIFSLAACGEEKNETPVVPDNPILPDDPKDPNKQDPDDPVIKENVTFSVSLIFEKKLYIPKNNEEIIVTWADEYAQYSEKIDSTGFAKKELDGDFNIYVSGLPEEYTYNPNIYTAGSESPTVEIELFKISKIRKQSGHDGTNEYKSFVTSDTGTFRTELSSKQQKVYYAFTPKKAGYYVVESYVNIYEDNINPKLDVFTGQLVGALYYKETLDDGGTYKKGGYTKNFKWVVKLSEQELHNSFVFGVYAETKNGVYPVNVDFSIYYLDEYYIDITTSTVIRAEEIKEQTPEFSKEEYKFINSDGGTGSYFGATTNGSGLLDGKKYKYNEETGYWHVYDSKTNTYGPILCAKITAPCAYYDESLNMIESHGNKNLTVSNGTENYKQFVEIDYAAVCNSDGVCYVTNELMIFLQKFSISQRLFSDGNGFVESTGVYAIEEDQWLFACGYYEEIK